MKNGFLIMLLKRIGQSIIVLFIVTLIVFLIMQAVPGDPIQNFLGPTATQEQIDLYTEKFGFDQPLFVQYFKWIFGLFRGEMGMSITYQKEISEIIFERLGVTLMIVIPAFIVAAIIGVTLGVIAALNRGNKIDSVISIIANIGMATPLFWLGILGIYIFSLQLGVLPVQGYVKPSEDLVDCIKHLVMPVTILSLGPLAGFTRQTRSAMLEVIRQDYVRTAEAKGVQQKGIIFRHELRNALIPIVTVMGMTLGGMIGATVLVESIYVIPGLGSLMIGAIKSKDYLVVENTVFIIAVAIAICNLGVDLLYGLIDPRISNKKGGR